MTALVVTINFADASAGKEAAWLAPDWFKMSALPRIGGENYTSYLLRYASFFFCLSKAKETFARSLHKLNS